MIDRNQSSTKYLKFHQQKKLSVFLLQSPNYKYHVGPYEQHGMGMRGIVSKMVKSVSYLHRCPTTRVINTWGEHELTSEREKLSTCSLFVMAYRFYKCTFHYIRMFVNVRNCEHFKFSPALLHFWYIMVEKLIDWVEFMGNSWAYENYFLNDI